MTLPGQDDVSLQFRPRPLALAEQDAIATLAAIGENRCGLSILPWMALMRGGDRPEVVAAWKEQAQRVADRARRLDYGAIAVAFAELVGCDAVWRKELEGWNVEESRWVNEWVAKGEAQGAAKARQEDFLRIVRLRFPEKVSPEIVAAVERQKDLKELSRWVDAAAMASDVAQLQTAVLGVAAAPSGT